jgi:hypothetical protein
MGPKEKMYAISMWRYALAAGLLSSFSLAFAQQAELKPDPGNAVPQENLNRALQRALAPWNNSGAPRLLLAGPVLESKACAVPLLETGGTETNDPIAHAVPAPSIDPKMVHAPPIPACPKP